MAPSKKDRILGALLGVHAGDSLGATYEFSVWSAIRQRHPGGRIPHEISGGGPFDWPAGHATDDTDLTRAVLLAYAAAAEAAKETGRTEPPAATRSTEQLSLAIAAAAGKNMLSWLRGDWPGRKPNTFPPDVGNATRVGLRKFAKNQHDPRRGGAGQAAAGNGSLMRCIPTALFAGAVGDVGDVGDAGEEDPGRRRQRATALLVQQSVLVSATTHNDWHCVLACVAYNTMVRALVDGAAPDAAVDAGRSALDPDSGTAGLVVSALAVEAVPGPPAPAGAAQTGPQAAGDGRPVLPAGAAALVQVAIDRGRRGSVRLAELADLGPRAAPGGVQALPRGASGYVLESLTLAVAALLDTERSLEDVLVDVVRVGSDTDTNAAIAGGLLGARDGVAAIPPAWRQKLQFGEEFTAIVNALVPDDPM